MTLEANRIARDTAARQLRAYVSIETVAISTLMIGQVPMFTATFKNFGQTPAHAFDIISFSTYITATDPDPDLPVLASSNAPSSLAPGSNSKSYTRLPYAWNQTLDQQLAAGQIRIVLFGRAQYTDIFGNLHSTGFKLYHGNNAPAGLTIHYPTGNLST